MTHNMTNFEMVGEFHEVFGHPINKEKQLNIFNDNMTLVNFRVSLIEEEINEFIVGVSKHDLIECIDALSDIMYVVYGACHVFGINFDKIKNDYLNDNSEKTNNIQNQISKLTNLLAEISKNICQQKEFDKFENYMCQIINTVYESAEILCVDQKLLDKCFAEVHRSNMSKSCSNELEAQNSVEWYQKNELRYAKPAYRKSTNEKYWVIFDQETSKILKYYKWNPPNLKSILESE